MCDCGSFVHRLQYDVPFYEASPWFVPGLTAMDVVQGVQHVGDCVLFSKVWCDACLEKGLSYLWPADMGFEVEERSPHMRFLQTALLFSDDRVLFSAL